MFRVVPPRMECSSTSIFPQYSQRSWRQAPQGVAGVSASVATAIVLNSRSPSLRAFHSATRSAHTVNPNDAFSILQPVKTRPEAVSIEAPTLNPENRASAFSRAWIAAAIKSLDMRLEESKEKHTDIRVHLRGLIEHLFVVDVLS